MIRLIIAVLLFVSAVAFCIAAVLTRNLYAMGIAIALSLVFFMISGKIKE